MADLDFTSILSALNASQKAAEEDNPFNFLSSFGQSLTPQVVQAAPNYSTGDDIIAGLVAGAVGGLTDSLSDNWKAKQAAYVNDALSNILTNGSSGFQRPDGMSNSSFATLKSLGQAMDIAEANQGAQAARAQKAKITDTLLSGAIQNPYAVDDQIAAVTKMNDLMHGRQPVAEQTSSNAQDVQVPQGGATVRDFKDYLKQSQGNPAAATAMMERDMKAPDRQKDYEKELASSFQGQQAVLDYTEMAKQFAAIQKAKDDPYKASDFDFAFGIMKILDPRSIVRESEQGQVIDSQSMSASIRGLLEGAMNGKAQLNSDARSRLIDLASRRFDIQQSLVDSLSSQYSEKAKRYGAEPSNIIIYPKFDALKPTIEAGYKAGSESLGQNMDVLSGAQQQPNTRKLIPVTPGIAVDSVTNEQYRKVEGGWKKVKE